MCPLISQLDERQKSVKSLAELFDDDVNGRRLKLVEKCEAVMYEDPDFVSSKPREILWRKGYYETISMAKRLLKAASKSNQSKEEAKRDLELLAQFLDEGIDRLKRLIVGIEHNFNLDLQFLIEFRLFSGKIEPVHEDVPINKKITSLEIINFALETIHALIISVGDLHRYYLDFGLNKVRKQAEIDQGLVSAYYYEAFKLNPKVGMPQNQLGTLVIGQHYNLDSVYHYLYSLICQKPFEMSDDNVNKIFLQNATYLEELQMDEEYRINLKDFIARFLLIVDIFFYDKDVANFSDLCRYLLMDLNNLLKTDSTGFTQDILYKFVSILFFCMVQLRRLNSAKVYHLNAFLAAICDQLVDACIANFDVFFREHEKENSTFIRLYNKRYDDYNHMVEVSREGDVVKDEVVRTQHQQNGRKIHKIEKLKSQDNISENNGLSSNSQNGIGSSSGPDQPVAGTSSLDGKSNERWSSDEKPLKGKKKVPKVRRRRRRVSFSSDSDLTSNFDSDSEAGGESDEFSQFSDSEDNENSDVERVDKELENHMEKIEIRSGNSSDSDIIIEEETIVFIKGTNGVNNNDKILEFQDDDHQQSRDTFESLKNGKETGFQKDRLRYKINLCNHDPNLMLKFSESEPTILALKVLFDWLMNNKDIIWGCYQSNPKFVHKIMTLLNQLNVNIFTRKVFFDRDMLNYPGLRFNIRDLFEERAKIPIKEDLLLKHFGLFQINQQGLDWEINSRLNVTPNEENLLRLVKLKSFGFFICDRKKFGYTFKNRIFEQSETAGRRRRNNKGQPEKRFNGEKKRERNRGKREKRFYAKNDWNDGDSSSGKTPDGKRKGYLRKKMVDPVKKEIMPIGHEKKEAMNKNELMGKLWLRSEVKSLESKVSLG